MVAERRLQLGVSLQRGVGLALVYLAVRRFSTSAERGPSDWIDDGLTVLMKSVDSDAVSAAWGPYVVALGLAVAPLFLRSVPPARIEVFLWPIAALWLLTTQVADRVVVLPMVAALTLCWSFVGYGYLRRERPPSRWALAVAGLHGAAALLVWDAEPFVRHLVFLVGLEGLLAGVLCSPVRAARRVPDAYSGDSSH